MVRKIILLNGSKRSGKTTAAKIIANVPKFNATVWGFSYHLKRYVHGIYLGDKGWNMDPDVFDAIKDEPQDMLDGKSWRQMYINYSENVIKPLHGKQWFGKMFLNIVRDAPENNIVVPDSGFYDEALPVIDEYGLENVMLLEIHRNDTSFAGDSRSYIDLPCKTVKINNNGTPSDYLQNIISTVTPFLTK